MDYFIRFIGLLIVVTGGTSPDVMDNTTFAPRWQPGLAFCRGAKIVPRHDVFIRVSDFMVDPAATRWPGQTPCSDPMEHCMLFPINAPSQIVIDSGFTPTQASTPGSTFSLLPRVGAGVPLLKLVRRPQTVATATVKMPGGTMEAIKLGNGTAITWVHVKAPSGTNPTPITIQAIPVSGGGPNPPTLVVKAGTAINIVNLPPDHAGLNLDLAAPTPHDPNHLHYYLVNALLPPQFHRCLPPSSPPDLDPLCSNQGCCP